MQCVHNLLADWYALNDPEIISAWDWTIKRQTYSLVFVVRILLHETCLGLELTLEFLPLSEGLMFLLLSLPAWEDPRMNRDRSLWPLGMQWMLTTASQVDTLHDLSWSCYILDFPRACSDSILTKLLVINSRPPCRSSRGGHPAGGFLPHFPLPAFVNVAAAYLRLSFFKVYSSVAFSILTELCNLPKILNYSSVCKNIFFDADISWDRHYNFIPTISGLWTLPYSFGVLASHTVSVGPGALALPSSSQVSVGGLSSSHYAKGPLFIRPLFWTLSSKWPFLFFFTEKSRSPCGVSLSVLPIIF